MIFCSLYSGSSGNSIFVSSDNAKILIDAGLSGKSIESALKEIEQNPNEIDGIFVTHEHIDHVKGAGIISRKFDIPIYANEKTWFGMEKTIGKIKEHNIKCLDKSGTAIKDMFIESFNIPHDAANPTGYSVNCNNKKISIATDLGYFTEEVKQNISGSDLVLIESNHDVEMLKFGPYPYNLKRRVLSDEGHLSNEACGNAIVEILKDKPKRIVLGHLSKTNNYPELAYQTVVNILNENGVVMDKDIILSIADRNKPSSYMKL